MSTEERMVRLVWAVLSRFQRPRQAARTALRLLRGHWSPDGDVRACLVWALREELTGDAAEEAIRDAVVRDELALLDPDQRLLVEAVVIRHEDLGGVLLRAGLSVHVLRRGMATMARGLDAHARSSRTAANAAARAGSW